MEVVDNDITKLHDKALMMKHIYILVGLVFAETVLNFFLVYFSNYISQNVIRDIRERLYAKLITEEYDELQVALANKDAVETLDALVDILVVTIGAINSMGADGEGAWREVMATNFAKIDRQLGKVRRREDGKILKPEGWEPPKLANFLKREH
jgi:predicted HAD superfamily Cof-like phosphohydrolase